MKTITFTKELIPLIQSGRKTQTRRKISYNIMTRGEGLYKKTPIRRLEPGDICVIKNSRFKPDTFGYIKIIEVQQQRLDEITEWDAKREGFDNPQEYEGSCADQFFLIFCRINKINLGDAVNLQVWKIEFEYMASLPKKII